MSITKPYTALALGRALQLGHLKMPDLDRPVLDFLKEIDRSKLAVGCDTITLNDALIIHSGIRVDKETMAKLRRSAGTLKGQGQILALFLRWWKIQIRDCGFGNATDSLVCASSLYFSAPTPSKSFTALPAAG